MKVDFIIVGHGLASVAVIEHLIKQDASFIVFSDENPNSSSKVAAGLYNPVTGRKMKQTWMAEQLFPYLEEFYGGLEKSLKAKFLHKKAIYRPFLSLEDQNDWMAKQNTNNQFIKDTFTNSQFSEFISDEFGGILLNHSGFLDVSTMLDRHKEKLIDNKQLTKEKLEYEKLIVNESQINYKEIESKKIIFCDGPLSRNPFFEWLPTAPVKGEILHIKTEKPLPDDLIFNRGVFLVNNPHHDYYRVGATYEWKNLDYQPTEKARKQLIDKLDDLLQLKYQILDQVAGIRPASKDRRPLIGNHPERKNVFIFNGLGTKGVSLAPYFARQFVNSIFNFEKLNDEVNINRYYPLYSN
ncbi:FAD-dependent oxidoreductase [Marivirga tractuosa]|uniref:FAD dependent oxidoreductase n=1 Tax=Marivirga tractuosa (strain ATCC 23168 / DSM 4126 / NBRC 15989 / NCIMB 1408 / VKM B-1430 / H-43) TaxID=643867 RepID=E4TRK7_MARTH|nr:FAD-binding oxidoreductase [Marivirga tractuosa]ADR21728.1 FAD dependent oxidoreductase [Marivirga tractuosa DSM 4126]BDD13814.1 FAD-dependent oxidoreductase [Marivirga tractuosa]